MAVARSLDELATQIEEREASKLEVAVAQRDSLYASLKALVAYLRKVDGFVPHDVQQELWNAEAKLVELKG